MTVSTPWGKTGTLVPLEGINQIKSELSEKIDSVKETGEKRHYNVSESDKGGTSDLKRS